MATFQGKFASKRNNWDTPQGLFDKLNYEFGFTCDLAAEIGNAKCNKFYSKDDNALEKEWFGICWLNPPYGDGNSKLSDWVKKAYSQDVNNCVTVMLIPARTNTVWWHDYCMKAKEVRFIKGRPKFGDAKHGLPQPLAIVVFAKHYGETKFSSFSI